MMRLDPKLCLIFLGLSFFCYERIHFAESLKLDAKDQHNNLGYEIEHFSNKGELCLNGEILESGVCKVAGYRSDLLPGQSLNIFVTLAHQSIHDINDNRNTFTMNMKMKLYWRDPGIITRFDDVDQQRGYIPLSTKTITKIWTPEIFVFNMSDYREFINSRHVSGAKLLHSNKTKSFVQNNDGIIEMTMSFRATVYCQFDFTNYPVDKSSCSFAIGSQYGDIRYESLHQDLTNNRSFTDLYECSMNLSNSSLFHTSSLTSHVSINVMIKRIFRPFMYRYYVPVVTAVIISGLGQVFIPTKCVSGKIMLSATIFLLVRSVFAVKMVSSEIIYKAFVIISHFYVM